MGEPASETYDPTVYREEDDVGEHEIQTYILELLRPLIERYLRQQGTDAHVGSDQFIYWAQHDPAACVAPDIYVLPGVSQDIAIGVWKIWETGVVPSLAIEVVGRDPYKDYEEAPRRYAELGVSELVVFDPFPAESRNTFTVYRREAGTLRRIAATNEDRIRCEVLSCWLRHVGTEATTRLRLATGETGDLLFPTAEEAEREAAAAEREAAAAERATAQAERAAKELALARIAELEAELKRKG